MDDFSIRTAHVQFLRLRRLARLALPEFGLQGARITPIQYVQNATYRVAGKRDGQVYLLRVHSPHRSAVEICSEIAWLESLNESGFVVPRAVRTAGGATMVSVSVADVPEPRYCTLMTWIRGRFERLRRTPSPMHRVGALMARLHEHSRHFSLPPGFSRPRWDSSMLRDDPVLREGWRRLPQGQCRLFERVVRMFEEVSGYLGSDPQVFGLIHGDFTFTNILFQGREPAAVDFDDCGFGYFLYDLASLLDRIEWRRDYALLRSALLEGYRSVRALSREHEKLLDRFLVTRWVFLGLGFLGQPEHARFREYAPQFLQIVLPKMRTYIDKF